jgi:hypothetical protein
MVPKLRRVRVGRGGTMAPEFTRSPSVGLRRRGRRHRRRPPRIAPEFTRSPAVGPSRLPGGVEYRAARLARGAAWLGPASWIARCCGTTHRWLANKATGHQGQPHPHASRKPSPPGWSHGCPRRPCPRRAPNMGPRRSSRVSNGRSPEPISCTIRGRQDAGQCFPSSRCLCRAAVWRRAIKELRTAAAHHGQQRHSSTVLPLADRLFQPRLQRRGHNSSVRSRLEDQSRTRQPWGGHCPSHTTRA